MNAKKLVSFGTATAVIAGLLLTISPAQAATPTLLKDTLDRLKISVSATHNLSMTLPAGGITTGNTLTVTYTGFGTDFAGTPTVTCGAGTATAGFATNVLTLTGGGTACTGTLTVTPFTGTNPGTAGSKTITLAGDAGITGTFAISIMEDDQVTVTASVDPSITFDLDTPASGATCSETASNAVAFGTITTADVESSGPTDSVQRICADLATNATGGAAVTVKSTNAALKSTITPADTIPSATATMAAGTANYGICVSTTASGLTAASPFASTCTINGNTNSVGLLSGATQSVFTSTGPIAAGTSEITANAAISGVTPAHADYTDTLTFIATGTF